MSNPFVLAREAAGTPFVATIGDTSLSFKPFGDLDSIEVADLFGRADDLSNIEVMVAVLRLAASDEDYEALRGLELTAKELGALYSAYQEHTGEDEGESPASSA